MVRETKHEREADKRGKAGQVDCRTHRHSYTFTCDAFTSRVWRNAKLPGACSKDVPASSVKESSNTSVSIVCSQHTQPIISPLHAYRVLIGPDGGWQDR